jgi:3',5'-cyclic AMP phosphodiesterase CpdA
VATRRFETKRRTSEPLSAKRRKFRKAPPLAQPVSIEEKLGIRRRLHLCRFDPLECASTVNFHHTACRSSEVNLPSEFHIAHLTDAHLPPAPWPPRSERALKRTLGYINWKRARERNTDGAMLSRLVADMRAHQPDHVAMTGDIVNLALDSEFRAARPWLQSLGTVDDVSFVPGNHDSYVASALPSLAAAFGPWTTDGARTSGAFAYPYLRVRGKVAFIGLNSGVPTGLFMATGRLGTEQIERLRRVLSDCAKQGLARVIMVHHAPVLGIAPMRRMIDAPETRRALAEEGAELVLHGHHHKRMVDFIDSEHTRTAGGRIPVIGAPSASTRLKDDEHRAAYHLVGLAFQGEQVAVKITARGPDVTSGEIIQLPQVL